MIDRRAFLAGAVAVGIVPRAALSSSVMDRAVAAVDAARYIAIGERHDNPEHHRLQAELVAALKPAGLAFEMLPQDQEATVNDMRAAGKSPSAIAEKVGWESRGWPDFALYAPIFEAAPDAYIACGGLSKQTLGGIYRSGVTGLGPEMTARYALDAPLPEAAMTEMLDEQFAAHCEMLPREKLGAMVEVQRAWDASYADALLRAGTEGAGRSILICGNAHARLDRGAPAILKRALPSALAASIGMLEGDEIAPQSQYSATLTADAPDREDPCEQMRKAMEKG